MTRWNGFARSLGFAAVAAAGAPAAWLWLGAGRGLALAWIALVALYASGLAPGVGAERRTRALGAFAGVAAAGGAAVLLGAGAGAVAAAVTAALSIVRTGWLYPGRGASAWALEIALGVGSIGLACWLVRGAGGGAEALALGVWGHLLVQSVYWLVPGGRGHRPWAERDGFEAACRRLSALLDETP